MNTMPVRSYLFVPGNRPGRFDKARESAAERIILDLEDAVAPTQKHVARGDVSAWLQAHRPNNVLVRVNAVGTSWYDDDMRMLDGVPFVGVMLPKAEPASMAQCLAACASREAIALVETVRGVLDLRETAALPGLQRIAFGSIDFAVDAGMEDGIVGSGLDTVRVQIALQSRLAGLEPPIDGVCTDFDTPEAVAIEAHRARQLGFRGKLCIHPRQAAAVNAAFRPGVAELEWARRVVDGFATHGGEAFSLEGRMVDLPVVTRARRLLDEA